MTQQEELKPCPFCGSAAEDGMGYNYHKVCCSSLACRMSNMYFTKKEWNMRAKAQAVPQWIPVSERLPENKDGLWSDPVIAMTDTGNIYRLSYCGGWQRTSEFMASGSSKVTHWMPLPPAPEQDKGGE